MRLLDNREFVEDLHRALASAERRVLIQVMTFDGDASGLTVADLLAAAAGRGVDVRLLVDCFALRYVSDRKDTDPSVQDEVAATKAMFDRLRVAGVDVTFTQPFGPVKFFGLSRNHKKLYVVDDHAYLGGINISDHNFAWRDFMIRTTDPAIVDALAQDFARTERGDRRSVNTTVLTNREIEPAFTEIINGASRSLVLASPYSLDVGIVKLLGQARAPAKAVITARQNNYRWLRLAEPYIWRPPGPGRRGAAHLPGLLPRPLPAGRRRQAAHRLVELQPSQLPVQPGGLPVDHRPSVHRRLPATDAGRHRPPGAHRAEPQPRGRTHGRSSGPLLLPRPHRRGTGRGALRPRPRPPLSCGNP